MTKTIIKKYSTAFKQQVVNEYEKGSSIRSLNTKYAIGGNNTIKQWIEKYSRQGLRHKLMVIQTPGEQEEVKKLKEKIVQLEKAVAQLTLDKMMLEATLDTVEEELGEDPKKNGVRQSSNGYTDAADNKETP